MEAGAVHTPAVAGVVGRAVAVPMVGAEDLSVDAMVVHSVKVVVVVVYPRVVVVAECLAVMAVVNQLAGSGQAVVTGRHSHIVSLVVVAPVGLPACLASARPWTLARGRGQVLPHAGRPLGYWAPVRLRRMTPAGTRRGRLHGLPFPGRTLSVLETPPSSRFVFAYTLMLDWPEMLPFTPQSRFPTHRFRSVCSGVPVLAVAPVR